MEFLGECGTKYDNRYSLYFNIKVYFKFYHLTPYNGDNMKVNGKNYTSIWFEENNKVFIIDQRWLPHEFKIVELKNINDFSYPHIFHCSREIINIFKFNNFKFVW